MATTSSGSGKRKTRAEYLRAQLSDEIVNGALPPGTQLDEAGLASRFGVSRTPVREALRNLASSGLVEIRPHRGAVVALPTPTRLMDMFRAMAELEALCAGLAAIEMTGGERDRLARLHEAMNELVLRKDAERYREANEQFHALLYDGAHNGYLAELALQTRVRVSPFRWAQFNQPGRLASSHAEHENVVSAIMRRDRERTTLLMRAHIDTVRDAYREFAGL